MDNFFTPTRRLRDAWESNREDPFPCTEVKLDLPVEELQIYPWNWPDFQAYATDGGTQKIVWVAADTFLLATKRVTNRDFDTLGYHPHLCARLESSSGEEQWLSISKHGDSDLAASPRSCFWRMVATSKSAELTLLAYNNAGSILPSGPVLAQLLGGSSWRRDIGLVALRLKSSTAVHLRV